jgi:hypothetical protein
MLDVAIADTARPEPEAMELATRAPMVAEPAMLVAERSALLLDALERSHDLGEVINLDQQAGALSGLARAARLGLEQQNQLAAARVRIQYRAGSLLRELATDDRPGRARRARGKQPYRPQLPPGTLERCGINGLESSNWQAMASVPLAPTWKRVWTNCRRQVERSPAASSCGEGARRCAQTATRGSAPARSNCGSARL